MIVNPLRFSPSAQHPFRRCPACRDATDPLRVHAALIPSLSGRLRRAMAGLVANGTRRQDAARMAGLTSEQAKTILTSARAALVRMASSGPPANAPGPLAPINAPDLILIASPQRIGKLSPAQRRVAILLRRGVQQAEIARRLGIAKPCVTIMLRRARARLAGSIARSAHLIVPMRPRDHARSPAGAIAASREARQIRRRRS